MKSLRSETTRHILRTTKKVAKANASSAQDAAERQALLQCHLRSLRDFEVDLMEVALSREDLVAAATLLGLWPLGASKQQRGPGKKARADNKRPAGPRMPYRKYMSADEIEIYVGKQAQDNDELSTSREHRSPDEWWMHANGCPGSHVVIKCKDEVLPSGTVQDAAALAARHSKCAGAGNVKVTLTRCRNVSKPAGAKPGLVQLAGPGKLVPVNLHAETQRLERLDAGVVV